MIAEGLGLLVEHVATLRDDLTFLADAKRPRGAAAVDVQSQEEAAKVLILLDLVRMDWADHQRVKAQIARFYQHLARCIYAEVAHTCPADFAEVREMVDHMRQSHYLDGPNDVDWIYRNRLLALREDGLYVDYVIFEDGPAWVAPATYDDRFALDSLTTVQDLVLAQHRLGMTSRPGLDIIADVWAGQTIEDSTHWSTVAGLNQRVVTRLVDEGAWLSEATVEDARLVMDRWTFPLHGLDLNEVEVPVAELKAQREQWLAAQGGW